MLHNYKGIFSLELGLGVPVTLGIMGTVLPGAVLEQMAIPLVLLSLCPLHSVPGGGACSVCGRSKSSLELRPRMSLCRWL